MFLVCSYVVLHGSVFSWASFTILLYLLCITFCDVQWLHFVRSNAYIISPKCRFHCTVRTTLVEPHSLCLLSGANKSTFERQLYVAGSE